MKISRTHKPEDLSLEDWQRDLRNQYGEQQKYNLENTGNHPHFSEFKLTSRDILRHTLRYFALQA